VTGPLTPSNRSSQDHDPDGRPDTPPAGQPWPAAADERPPGELRTEMGQAALVLVVTALCGLLLGALWLWLAPRVPLVSDGTAVFLKDTEGEEAIGADGTFVLLGLAFGLVSAVVVFLLRRRGGVPLVFGLAIGGLLGSLLAWKFGGWLGPTSDVVAHAKQVGRNVTFDAPLELGAKGALLAWPVAAMVVFLVLTAAFAPRDPEPRIEWYPPAGGRAWSSHED
jgi:hypothetical protein